MCIPWIKSPVYFVKKLRNNEQLSAVYFSRKGYSEHEKSRHLCDAGFFHVLD